MNLLSLPKIRQVKLKRIILTQFRNHTATALELRERVVGISGSNGAGKTSILEAIHFLAVSRGMNSASDSVYLMKGNDFFRLEGLLDSGESEEETHKLVVKYQLRKAKVLEWNGEKVVRLGDHIGRFPVVSMSPQDIDLVLAGSRERRRIIDLAFSQIDKEYLEQLMFYRRMLKQRNAYLKSLSKTAEWKPAMLSTFDSRMAPAAQVIFEKRKSYLDELENYFLEFYQKVSERNEMVEFKYQSELAEHDFEFLTIRNQDKDRFSGRTNSGIHKDDLELLLYNAKLKDTASQGQLKSAVLALKLSVWELIRKKTGKDPLFLLDDLFDRLDESRATAFLNLVKERSTGQIFITDTHPERLRSAVEKMNLPYHLFVVENGELVS